MKGSLLANRYAGGLAQAIGDDNQLEPVAEALRQFADLLHESDSLRNTLLNPALDPQRRRDVLDDVLASLPEFPEPPARLVRLMLKRGRMNLVADVAQAFDNKVDERLNRIEATLTTAIPLPEELREQLREALAAYTGKTVRVHCHTDPNIIDGVIAEIEGVVLDGSLRTQLERLKEAMLEKEIVFDENASD